VTLLELLHRDHPPLKALVLMGSAAMTFLFSLFFGGSSRVEQLTTPCSVRVAILGKYHRVITPASTAGYRASHWFLQLIPQRCVFACLSPWVGLAARAELTVMRAFWPARSVSPGRNRPDRVFKLDAVAFFPLEPY